MDTVNLAGANAHLSERMNRVEAGGSIGVMINVAMVQSLTATWPPQPHSAADLVRSMRDGDRF